MTDLLPTKSKWIQSWPVGLCWLLLMIANAVAGYAMDVGRLSIAQDLVITVVINLWLGQFALAAIIAGLVGRTWLSGWLIAVLLATVATFAVWASADNWRPWDILSICSLWPLSMLGASAPLIAMRRLFGWSLTTRESNVISKVPASVEDLFLLCLVVASCFTFARLAEELEPSASIEMQFFIPVLFSAFSLLFVLPTTAITFLARTWIQRWIGWLSMSVVVLVAAIVMFYLFDVAMNSISSFWADFPHVFVGVATSTGTVVVCLWALFASGFRLTRFAQTRGVAEKDLSLESDVEIVNMSRARLQSRQVSAFVIICAVIAAIMLNFANYDRVMFFRGIQTLKRETKLVRTFQIRGDKVSGATLLPTVTDANLKRYSHEVSELERLSLSGTLTTDAAINTIVNFRHLKHLDLSNTAITNDGLKRLTELKQLGSLSIANTKVDFPTVLDVAKTISVIELDVSGIGVSDEQLHVDLSLGSILALNLSHNPITDAGLSRLLQCRFALSKIDVSDTAIDGSGFALGTCPARVILDGTKINDANLLTLVSRHTLRGISIRRTGITPAVLPAIAKRELGLMLGEGLINEQDLINLGKASFRFLALNDKKFTGACLGGGVYSSYLDLSHSGVTEKSLLTLANQPHIHVNLSNTAIKDVGYIFFNCNEVDIRNTYVTAQSLKKIRGRRVLISSDQFTASQLASLPPTSVHIDEDNSFPKW